MHTTAKDRGQEHSSDGSNEANLQPLETTDAEREAISRRAYGIWEEGGRQEGSAESDWRQAEQELSGSRKEDASNDQ